jgi:hypothetical protein
MSTSHRNNKSIQRGIRFEHDDFKAIEELRGDVSFSMWVKRAVKLRLEQEKKKLR